ncbi:MAG TPA: hypothetical protein VGI04_11570 [Neobacillus sp.]
MVIQQPHMEQTDLTQYIPPKGEFESFRDVEHYKEKLKEWGLSSAKEAKTEFLYKDKNYQRLVSIKGYETYGKTAEFNTIVIQFQNGQLSCIHPAYLKEMQQSSFGKESVSNFEETELEGLGNNTGSDSPNIESGAQINQEAPSKAKKEKVQKSKKEKIDLPVEKVHFTAQVKQFAMTYNPFNEENDEVVVLENVLILQEPPIELGTAWCSHSKTLKKFELVIGDQLEFDGKVAAKKLAIGKDVPKEFEIDSAVMYKINNPSKIEKKEQN